MKKKSDLFETCVAAAFILFGLLILLRIAYASLCVILGYI